MVQRRFRFGVQASAAVGSRRTWADLARKVEDLGYSTLSIPDHFDAQLAPAVALMAAADATTTLRVGALVWCNDYRHPVVLAKEVATLDLLSEGRVELGLGAGWMRRDYDQAGLAYDPPGVRVDRLVESLEVLKGLFGHGPCHFEGRHYRIAGLDGTPKPVQRPHPPILIGGGGPRMLTFAGRHADIVGVNPNLASGEVTAEVARDATAERFAEKVAWVAEAAGERFERVELNVRCFFVVFTHDRVGTAEAMGAGMGLSADQALSSPLALVGTAGDMVEVLRERRERLGLSYVTVGPDDVEAFAPVVAELAGT
jgi:probable F420-dependent oxidoreductase